MVGFACLLFALLWFEVCVWFADGCDRLCIRLFVFGFGVGWRLLMFVVDLIAWVYELNAIGVLLNLCCQLSVICFVAIVCF